MPHQSDIDPSDPIIDRFALRPLFKPDQEPSQHRAADAQNEGSAKIVKHRRPSQLVLVNHLREEVGQWRRNSYLGASKTSHTLLSHWFRNAHRISDPDSGDDIEFSYYFCQREAIETLIYLMEVRGVRSLSALVHNFGGGDLETRENNALGIAPEEDMWPRYAFKLATGAGKTKCMSLAIVWSYFHSLYEADSNMARHFVIIAPNLTVFERLREDFRPEIGGQNIFDKDPLIPREWRTDWNFSVILQDEPASTATGAALYLTNIHRLFPKKRQTRQAQTHGFAGPSVSRATVLDTAQELRKRIISHPNLMVMNDEAHHVWDPDSAWNEAIKWLNKSRAIAAQLDFSATPKDSQGNLFRHTVCDTSLGEAVDAGIVKTPVIGHANVTEQASDDAAERYDMHLRLGYERWQKSYQEWHRSGRRPLLFVMCENTEAANQIANKLNTNPVFEKLNGKTINLHTNLKGKIKKIRIGSKKIEVFEENEKQISDEDLKALRRLSRDLDRCDSPYLCIVSVLMLREGWDVRNVTTIVPLRAYTATSKILPEQTLGRGLRRMTAPGSDADEIVTVIEHPAFKNLYESELAQEGLPIASKDVGEIEATTTSIFPDTKKDIEALDISFPLLSPSIRIAPLLEEITEEQIRNEFTKYMPLPLGRERKDNVDYEGRHLITNEVIEAMSVYLPLLEHGVTAIAYFAKKLGKACRIQNSHSILAPLLEIFLTEILFGEKLALTDTRLLSRLSQDDVDKYICAVFIPLIRARTIQEEKPQPQHRSLNLSSWRPYQVTQSKSRPVVQAKKTLFNLVPCTLSLEVAMTEFLDKAPDIARFAKNAGPQALRIDYLTVERTPSLYTPDFFACNSEGECFLIETKGQQDKNVPAKAQAAAQWCAQASSREVKWQYVYVPQTAMQKLSDNNFSMLARACEPTLKSLLSQETPEPELLLYDVQSDDNNLADFFGSDIAKNLAYSLTDNQINLVRQAIELFHFLEKKEGSSLAPVFVPLLGALDAAATGFIVQPLRDRLPDNRDAQNDWFNPDFSSSPKRTRQRYEKLCSYLRKGVVHNILLSPLGRLRDCMDYALNERQRFEGVLEAVRAVFRFSGARKLLDHIESVNNFRNHHVAHNIEEPLLDREKSKRTLKQWVSTLALMSDHLR